jgi:hypothetical protein
MPDDDSTIPDEAVEAACEAYENDDRDYVAWSMYDETAKQECRVDMERALAAAYPLLLRENESNAANYRYWKGRCESHGQKLGIAQAENARLGAQVEAAEKELAIANRVIMRHLPELVEAVRAEVAALSDEGEPGRLTPWLG